MFFLLSLHHSVTDGVSLDLLTEEIFKQYGNNDNCSKLKTDFYEAFDDSYADENKVFWKDYLADIDDVPKLPIDRFSNSSEDNKPQISKFKLDSFTSETISKIDSETSLFSKLATIYAIQISGLTGKEDVLFSIQSAGRHGLPKDVLGSFSNALPIRVKIAASDRVCDITQQIQKNIKNSLINEKLPFQNIQNDNSAKADFALNL